MHMGLPAVIFTDHLDFVYLQHYLPRANFTFKFLTSFFTPRIIWFYFIVDAPKVQKYTNVSI